MFGFLKKKLAKVVDSLAKRIEERPEPAEKPVQDRESVRLEPLPEPAEVHDKTAPLAVGTEMAPKITAEEKEPGAMPGVGADVEEPVAEVGPWKEGTDSGDATREKRVPEKKSFFKRMTEGLVRKVTEKRLSERDIDPILEELETSMIESDVAVEVAEKVKTDLRGAILQKTIKRGKEREIVLGSLRKSLLEVLDVPNLDIESFPKRKKPVVIAFWGFNGAGKTTSLAKTASWLKSRGYSCVLAAADTFRAGAEEQLETHAKNIGARVIKHRYGADPAAVIYDAVEHAKARGIDFVLADTAGRAHTNSDLMNEMKKIVRVNKPDLKVLVVDSLTGNDAVAQARMYSEIGVDALVFTKLDVNEKGGAILSVTHELRKPILFLGMGQEYKDFQEFDAERFVSNLLG